MKTLRWILVPIVTIVAWFFTLLVGTLLVNVAGAASSSAAALRIYFVAALCAVAVVTSAFFTAPAAKVKVAWVAFAAGSIAVFWMWMPEDGVLVATTISTGLATTLLLTRSPFTERPTSADIQL